MHHTTGHHTPPHPTAWVRVRGPNFRRYCSTQDRDSLNRFWVLLHNQSTMDVFCNKDLITNIRRINKSITIRTSSMVGYFRGYGWICYSPRGTASIISLKNMKALYRATYDSASNDGGHFVVHRHMG